MSLATTDVWRYIDITRIPKDVVAALPLVAAMLVSGILVTVAIIAAVMMSTPIVPRSKRKP